MSSIRSGSHGLPATAPGIIDGDLKNTGTLPLALYTLDGNLSTEELQSLASQLEEEYIIDMGNGEQMHLIRPAPSKLLVQPSLKSTLDAHVQYGNENKLQLEFFPFCFLVAHDCDWNSNGLWIVHVEFEDGNPVTAFRVKLEDLGEVCTTLRDDEDGAEVLREQYGLEE